VDERGELDRSRVEIEELRAARRRLVQDADDDRRTIERALHGGLHQQLVALAVGLQLLEQAVHAERPAVEPLLDEMRRDIRQALDEAARLAQRIYPATLGSRDLAALLRAAAVTEGVPAFVEVAAGSNYSPDVVMTVYLCWLDTLASELRESRATISVRESEGGLAFEVTGSARSESDLRKLQDRVEALDGHLTVSAGPEEGARLSAFLPLSR